jgi:hypothetical protein
MNLQNKCVKHPFQMRVVCGAKREEAAASPIPTNSCTPVIKHKLKRRELLINPLGVGKNRLLILSLVFATQTCAIKTLGI